LVEPVNGDAVRLEIGCSAQTIRGLARDHAHGVNPPLRRCGDRVESQERSSWHDDLASPLLCQLHEFRSRQEGAGREHHHLLSGFQHRPADFFEDAGRRAFHGEIAMIGKRRRFHQRAVDPLGSEPSLALVAVARCGAGERQPRQPFGELAGNRAPDRAKPCNRDAGRAHDRVSVVMTGASTRRYGLSQGWQGKANRSEVYSNSISPLISWESPIPAIVTVALAGNFSLPLSLPSARLLRTAFSISRWALTPSVLRNFLMLPLSTSSFMTTLPALLPRSLMLAWCFAPKLDKCSDFVPSSRPTSEISAADVSLHTSPGRRTQGNCKVVEKRAAPITALPSVRLCRHRQDHARQAHRRGNRRQG